MNENCMHSSLSAFIENLRREKEITIEQLALEAHVSTKTYVHIKKGLDVRMSAFESLFFYYLKDLEEDEIRRVLHEWEEELIRAIIKRTRE